MVPELDLSRIKHIVEEALEEDIGSGDITTDKIIPADTEAAGYIIAKEPGVIAGLPVAELVFKPLNVKRIVNEGDSVFTGQTVLEINGSARAILRSERAALNFLSYLSGIATSSRKFVDKVKDYGVSILDTRKTVPGMRYLEKYAVVVGGGENHRAGLYDQVLIKDNHLKILEKFGADYIHRAVKAFSCEKVEIEVQNVEQAEEAVTAGADILLLDNMNIEDIREVVRQFKGKVLLEVSGSVNLDNVAEIAMAGIDCISIGALTHSAPGLDLALEIA